MAITRDQVLAMDYTSIVAAIKAPETSREMQALLRDRQIAVHVSTLMQARQTEIDAKEAEVDAAARTIPPSTDQLAAEAAAVAAQSEPVVPPAAVVNTSAAEDAELLAAGITVVRDGNGKVLRYIEEYQVRDEEGQPIGRPTHLEGKTLPEFLVKKREAHQQATRAFHRLKKQKLTFKENESKRVLTPEEIKAAATKALEAKDATEAENIVKSILDTTFKQREQEIQIERDKQEGFAIGNQFLRNHLHDYALVEANNKALGEYLRDHGMDYTVDNLEAAFIDLMDQNKLVKVRTTNLPITPVVSEPITPQPTPEASAAPAALPPAPPAAPVTVPPAQPQAIVSQPAVAATAPSSVAPNQQPATRRPGVNGSLPPGSFSAERVEATDPAQARKAFLKQVHDMKPEIMKAKLKNDPQFVKQLEAYGIRIK